jgi:hypothetical protein
MFAFQLCSQNITMAANLENCNIKDAIYKPSAEKADTLRKFNMKFLSSEGNEKSSSRLFFLLINAFDQSEQNISSARFGYGCSNGVSVCRASAYYGQYNSNQKLVDIKNSPNFEVTFLSKSFEQLYPSNDAKAKAPYAIVLPNTAAAISYREKSSDKEYIKYFGNNHEFPDFSNYDVWLLNACKSD